MSKPSSTNRNPEQRLKAELEANVRETLGLDPDDEIEIRLIPLGALSGPFGRAMPPAGGLDSKSRTFAEFIETLGRRGIGNRIVTSNDEEQEVGGGIAAASPPTTAFPEPTPETGEARWLRQREAVSDIVDEVKDALYYAITKHRGMHSPHEGYAVIKEEFEELWDEIKADGGGRDDASRQEALQVAAMAIRYVLDLDPRD